jgi:FeS assembly SUF system regulator
MLKLSRLTDYAVVVLTIMENQGSDPVSAAILAEQSKLPEPTVAKILKLLAGGGLVNSIRGIKGGYILEKDLADISVKDVIHALDGPIALTACVESATGGCEFSAQCGMFGRWDRVNRAMQNALSSVSIADMLADQTARTKLKERA